MAKLTVFVLVVLVLPGICFGQSTTVSGTVTDSGAQTWNNGTYQFTFVPSPTSPNPQAYTWTGGTIPQNLSGVLSGTGTYTQSLPSNNAITPGGSSWAVQFCPLATSPCYNLTSITIIGSTYTLNASPPAISISLILPSAGTQRAYSDVEITSAALGSIYYNVSSSVHRACTAVTGQICTAWATLGGGGGGSPGGPNHSTQCNNSGSFGPCANTPGVLYVAQTGNDVNSGLTWDTAKFTIYAALQALPFGSAGKAGVGTIYVADGSTANPTATAGIWLMSSADPNFASPPTGWLQCDGPTCVPTIIGVPAGSHGANPHKGRAFVNGGSNSDNNHPGLWLSGQQNPVWISNIAFGSNTGRSMVIGECSNNATNGCGVAGVTLENVGGAAGTGGTQGPCSTITGASFWVWMRDFSCSGNAVNATGGPLANNAAAILINGTGNAGNGLVYIQDSNFALGGIKDIPGGTSPDTIYVTDVTEEGDFTHTIPPVVWFTSQFVNAIVKNPQLADPGASPPAEVQSDGASSSNSNINGITVIGNAITVQGKATVIGSSTSGGGSFLVNGTVGPTQGYILGQNDISRRGSPLTTNRFTNNGFTNPSSWTIPNGGGGVTTGITDPFGGTGAGTANGTPAAGTMNVACLNSYTPTAGDWLLMGVWTQNEQSVNGLEESACNGAVFGWTNAIRLTNNSGLLGDSNHSAWNWLWIADKVASNALITSVGFGPIISSSNLPSAYGPVLYVIPNGTLTDSEVAELLYSMNSVDNSCAIGAICNVAGHPLSLDLLNVRGQASAPSNPATGNCLQYFNTVTGQMSYINSTGGNCGPSGTISGLTAGQVGIAGAPTTITSSKAIQGTDANLLSSGTVSGTAATLCTDANGGATTAGCTGGAISGMTTGQVAIAGSASSITSSKALQGTDASILTSSTIAAGTGNLLCTDTGSGATTIGCSTGISGLTTGQIPVAGSATTLTSSKALQGTDTNILTSGTVSGTSAPLCTDANGGATTSGCPATNITQVYNTQSSATNTNIAATSMVASTGALHSYSFSWTISLTAIGSSCSSSTTLNMNAIFTDPNTSSSTTELLGTITIAAGGNGTIGFVAQGTDNILAKSGTAVQYSTSGYTAGTGCTVNPTYQVSPTLVQLW